MHITCQGGDVGDPGNMGLTVQDSLIQMGNAPALRNVKAKEGGQFLRGLSRDGILPGAEGRKEIPVLVEG